MSHLDLDLMARYLADQATEAERFTVECHLGECPDCVRRLRGLAVLRTDFDQVWEAWSAAGHGRQARRSTRNPEPQTSGARQPEAEAAADAIPRTSLPERGSDRRSWGVGLADWWSALLRGTSTRWAWAGVGTVLIVTSVALLFGPRLRSTGEVLLVEAGGEVRQHASGAVQLPGGHRMPREWQPRLDSLARGDPPEIESAVGARLEALRQREVRLGGSAVSEPVPLRPVGTLVPPHQVAFQWRSVAGATNYTLLVTQGNRVVYEAATGNRTHVVLTPAEFAWQPGTDYAWLVEAWVAGQPWGFVPVKFGTVAATLWDEVARIEQTSGGSALAMMPVYWRYGLFDEARDRLAELERLNPEHPSLVALRHALDQAHPTAP